MKLEILTVRMKAREKLQSSSTVLVRIGETREFIYLFIYHTAWSPKGYGIENRKK